MINCLLLCIEDNIQYDKHLYTNYAILVVNRESENPLLSSLSLLSIICQRIHALTNSFSDSLCESLSSSVNHIEDAPMTAGFKGKPRSAIQGERNVDCKEGGR
jgi:hypothetical protein